MILPVVLTIAAAALTAVAMASPPPVSIADLRGVLKPVASHRYAEGAPPGFSGGFKEQACDGCHFDFEPNKGPGKLALDGVPDQFAGGEQYRVTISLTQAGIKLAGFQLTSRFKDDGSQAGTLTADPSAPTRVAVTTESGVQYAGQRREGAVLSAADGTRWTIVWTAPSASRPVVFNVAANGANGDERANGDYVYTLTRETQPR